MVFMSLSLFCWLQYLRTLTTTSRNLLVVLSMFMLKTLLTFVFISTAITLAFAQTYQLTGQVVDEKGEPVPFASIYPRNAAHTGTSANSEGLFKLNVTAGTHE